MTFLPLVFLLSEIFTTGIFTVWHIYHWHYYLLPFLPMVFLPMAILFLAHTVTCYQIIRVIMFLVATPFTSAQWCALQIILVTIYSPLHATVCELITCFFSLLRGAPSGFQSRPLFCQPQSAGLGSLVILNGFPPHMSSLICST